MILFPQAQAHALQEALMTINHDNEHCSLTQLHGFLCGISITPEAIPNQEWETYIFNNEESGEQHKKTYLPLFHLAATYITTQFKADTLQFPFQYEQPTGEQIKTMIEWSSGLQAALLLRSSLWLGKDKKQSTEQKESEEMPFCFASLRAITKPSDIPTLFGQHLDDPESMDNNEKTRLFVKCLKSMPHLVQSLISFSQKHQNA